MYMADQISFLIVGNGIAGITAAETLRSEAPDVTIGLISDDGHPVYFRPALKDYLAGRMTEEKLLARPVKHYQNQHFYRLPERVVRIHAAEHMVSLSGGGRVKYQKMLLASGGRPARLSCPGADLDGVTTLRTVEDYHTVLERLAKVRHVVVCGSGTLALETAETLRHRGLEVSHLIRKRILWSEVLDATSSDLVLQEERRAGVDVRLETEIEEIIGSKGAVSAVVTNAGDRIDCDMVLVAIGIEPAIEYLRDSAIACRRGILVDEYMRTNVPDIYAAGDVVETVDASTKRARVIGQWYPAIQQGRAAAYSMLEMLDTTQPFRAETFYNATFLYGLPFASVGVTNAKGYRELLAAPKPRSYRKALLCDGVIIGMMALGDRKHTLAFKRAIDYQVNLDGVVSSLMNESFDLAACLDNWKVPPLVLGVRRAGVTVANQVIAAPMTQDLEQAGEDSMLSELASSEHTEAFLVHIVDKQLPLRVAENLLSRKIILTVGRQPGVNLFVNEGSVSRHHAQLDYHEGQYFLRDLKSLNGTFINDNRLEAERAYPLHVNDVIRFGNIVSFRFLLRALDLGRSPAKSPTNPVTPLATAPIAGGQMLPLEIAQPLPPAVLAALKQTPALVILPVNANAQKQPPQVYLLQMEKPVTIGRDVGNDVVVMDMIVSRHHAEVFSASERFYIRDVGSSNGISVNRSRIDQPYPLSHSDHIIIGNTMIFFIDLQSGKENTMRHQSVVKPVNISPVMPPTRSLSQMSPAAMGVETQIRAPVVAPPKVAPKASSPTQVVVCSRCGVVNMPVARFCAGCSALLHIP
jgi:NADPH-dependent 2,4-dienoyl-CoA reductase/sulfur reductase-like enzyme/pSer/pThr/pTyr-binding forkhead associated (FHA) protein